MSHLSAQYGLMFFFTYQQDGGSYQDGTTFNIAKETFLTRPVHIMQKNWDFGTF